MTGNDAVISDKSIERQLTIIRDAIEKIVVGFGHMLHIQQSHGLMLQSILEATTAELAPDSNLTDLMEQIRSLLARQSEQLVQLKEVLVAQRA